MGPWARRWTRTVGLWVWGFAITGCLTAAPPETLRAVVVAEGLDNPVHAVSPPGDPRLFIVEQPGRILSFGEDAEGELYVLTDTGRVHRIEAGS